jgi:pimeloyl-ACP methyl ester carboxylesterase
MVRAHWSDPKCFRALADYLESLPKNARFAASLCGRQFEFPVIILSAATATPEELQEREAWVRESRVGKHIRLPDSGHWIHLEQPDVVLTTISELLDKQKGPLAVEPPRGQ